jgi:transcriptional regulator with XRE-family HTH domain
MAGSSTKQGRGRRRPEDIDLHVASRLRTRRIMLGLTRKQLANSIGVTSTQAYKYETGGNRLTSGRLHQIAQALNTDVGYFFEGIARDDTFMPTQQQRLLLDLARNFTAIPIRKYREVIVSMARALAEPDAGPLVVRGSRRRVVRPG